MWIQQVLWRYDNLNKKSGTGSRVIRLNPINEKKNHAQLYEVRGVDMGYRGEGRDADGFLHME